MSLQRLLKPPTYCTGPPDPPVRPSPALKPRPPAALQLHGCSSLLDDEELEAALSSTATWSDCATPAAAARESK